MLCRTQGKFLPTAMALLYPRQWQVFIIRLPPVIICFQDVFFLHTCLTRFASSTSCSLFSYILYCCIVVLGICCELAHSDKNIIPESFNGNSSGTSLCCPLLNRVLGSAKKTCQMSTHTLYCPIHIPQKRECIDVWFVIVPDIKPRKRTPRLI